MPKVIAVSTANPPHVLPQSSAIDFAKSLYGHERIFTRLLPVFENALVEKRHLAVDIKWLQQTHSFSEVNDHYIETACDLSKRATIDAAAMARMQTEEFDVVFFLSTTGLSTPSIDARLFNIISLNPHIKRIPIWGLGCAAGAAGLARAYEYLKAFPTHKALIICVELCSLAFHSKELSKTSIISAAIFGDGAAACIMVGDEVKISHIERPCPSVLGSMSTIYPDSLDVMSWRATEDGFKVHLSRDIPSIVTSLVRANIEEFLLSQNLGLKDLTHLVFHPGGAKVLAAYADALQVPAEMLKESYDVLRNFGNMSSVTVFFILKNFLEHTKARSNEFGLVAALGPGFSSELVLLKWD